MLYACVVVDICTYIYLYIVLILYIGNLDIRVNVALKTLYFRLVSIITLSENI